MASLMLGRPGSSGFAAPCSMKWEEREMALTGRGLRRRWRGVTTWLTLLSLALFGSSSSSFAAPKQRPLHLQREQEGLGVSSPAGADFDVAVNFPGVTIQVTSKEKQLLSRLKGVGNGQPGQWSKVQKILATYSGHSPVVVNAGMQAAFKCGVYQEGVQMFERLRRAEAPITSPVYTMAMKLYGKLHRMNEVRNLWEELVASGHVDEVKAAACIDANANNGNITGAAEVLEYMENESIPMNEKHFTSAINACAKSNETYKANASKYLLQCMIEKNQVPDIVTYSCVVRSMSLSPVRDFLDLLADMRAQNVTANRVFAENFFFAFFKAHPKGGWMTKGAIATDLRKVPSRDLKTAKGVMDTFLAAGIDLTAMCKRINAVLDSLL